MKKPRTWRGRVACYVRSDQSGMSVSMILTASMPLTTLMGVLAKPTVGRPLSGTSSPVKPNT